MLLNVGHDRVFQRYLRDMEQRLHNRMVPLLSAGIRLQMSRGGIPAMHYVTTVGEPILVRHYRRVYEDAFDASVDQIEKAATTGRSAFIREQLAYLERDGATRIHDIAQSTADEIRDIVMAGVRDGKSHDRIAAELYRAIPDLSRKRSARIARTETHSAATSAIYETMKFKRVPVRTKTWWTANDNVVRPSHRDVHGVTIPFDQAFTVGGSLMMFPGDPSMGAGAEEIVNCRCSPLFKT